MAKPSVVPVIGFFDNRPRIGDYTGEVTNPFTGEVTVLPTMTKQEFIAECDINNIMKEFTVTGQINHISQRAAAGAFLDMPGAMDYQAAIHLQRSADAAFAQLPSQVRDRFDNDPAQFLEFFNDPANRDEAGKLGLLEPEAAPPPPVEVVIKGAPPSSSPGGAPGGTGGVAPVPPVVSGGS